MCKEFELLESWQSSIPESYGTKTRDNQRTREASAIVTTSPQHVARKSILPPSKRLTAQKLQEEGVCCIRKPIQADIER